MQKVASGDRLKIPASTFNTFIDAAQDYQRRSMNRESEAIFRDTKNGIVTIRNQSGADRSRFNVLALNGVVVTPTQNQFEFASRYAFTAGLPAAAIESRFVVLQEPVKSNFFCKAIIVGVTPVMIKRLTGDSSDTVGSVAGQTYLQTGLRGAQVLWEDSFTGENLHIALVRMPAEPPSRILRMRVTTVVGDYLICQRWDGSAWSATNENVAKPYLLRNSITARNGVNYAYSNTFTRTATQGSNTETQVIVPSYYTAGDELFVAEVPYTGVTVAGAELKLLDINADGRAWARSNP